jgi:hypothetical protein
MPVEPNPFIDVNVMYHNASDIDDDEATLAWTDPIHEALDHIEITWTPGGEETPLSIATGVQTGTITGLTADVLYTFTIRAVDTDNNKSGGVALTLRPNILQKWTRITTAGDGDPFGTTNVNGITWGGPSSGEKFVAVGASGKMAYSSDGITWTPVTDSAFGTAAINCITWGGPFGGEKFVAVGGGIKMAYSSDGVSWTAVTDAILSTLGATLKYITFDELLGRFLAGDTINTKTISSQNGTTNWIEETTPFAKAVIGVAWGAGKIVASDSTNLFWGPETANLADLATTGSSENTYLFRGEIGKETITGIAWGGPTGQKRFVVTAYCGLAYSAVLP